MWARTVLLLVAACVFSANAFVVPQRQALSTTTTALHVFGKKKKDEDLSFIESRDMTREEMERLNAENERVMNQELVGMTIFSLIISIPLLYLVWVGLFSETAELASDLSDITFIN